MGFWYFSGFWIFVVTEFSALGQNPKFRPRTKIQNSILEAKSKMCISLQKNQNALKKPKIGFQQMKNRSQYQNLPAMQHEAQRRNCWFHDGQHHSFAIPDFHLLCVPCL